MYKTKEEAIKQLLNGENFENKLFDLFRGDKEVVLEAVKQDGWALEYASDELKNDKEVILEAVKQNGQALQCASNDLRNDKEIVLEAVKKVGYALEHASDELKNDKEVVILALQYDIDAIEMSSDEIQALCKGKDPIDTLEKAIQAEKLSSSLEKSLPKSNIAKQPSVKV